MKTKFIENVGNSSTTATRNGKNLGHNVNVAAYGLADGNVSLQLESNGLPIKGIAPIIISIDAYQEIKSLQSNTPLFIRALEMFDCKTAWHQA